jgi:RecB family exonuclease
VWQPRSDGPLSSGATRQAPGVGNGGYGRHNNRTWSVMSVHGQPSALTLPRLSPSRLEAWDRCAAAYRFEYVLRLPQPIGDQRPRLLGSVAHALVEGYLEEALRIGARPPLTWVPSLAAGLVEQGHVPEASTDLVREATELVTRWLTQWSLPAEHLVAVEHALAVDASGRRVAWDGPDAFIRGRPDLVSMEQQHATVLDWKSGWVSEDEEGLRLAWAPGLYAALLWAWAPRLERISVEYHYLRTGRVARVALTRADAAETLAWARALASRIAVALATPDDPRAFPPRPSTACGTCPWVNRCPAGHADEARRLGGLLLTGEARVGRLRERLKAYLQDRKPLALDGLELGFFPTKGRYDAAAVFRAATDAGTDPWSLLAADGRTLAAFLKRRPGVEQTLAGAWTPSPAWFGHRKTKNATRGAGDPGGLCATDNAVREPSLSPGDNPKTPG